MKRSAFLMILAGCGSGPELSDGVSVREAYESGERPRLEAGSALPLGPRKEIPVLHPPEVFGVYVPPRISRSRDILVGDHWVFFKLRDAQWYPEKLRNEPRGVRDADPEAAPFLRKRLAGAGRIVVPEEGR